MSGHYVPSREIRHIRHKRNNAGDNGAAASNVTHALKYIKFEAGLVLGRNKAIPVIATICSSSRTPQHNLQIRVEVRECADCVAELFRRKVTTLAGSSVSWSRARRGR